MSQTILAAKKTPQKLFWDTSSQLVTLSHKKANFDTFIIQSGEREEGGLTEAKINLNSFVPPQVDCYVDSSVPSPAQKFMNALNFNASEVLMKSLESFLNSG